MKIAIFLDVDQTITTRTIQEVYAAELGLATQYKTIEDAFQIKSITSAEFGNRLIKLFASVGFSKTKAEALFSKVETRDGVEKIFALQEKGVDVFLVSSGPNYYVDILAQRKGVPFNRVLCSNYVFGEDGIILKCYAVEDQDKVQFVVDNFSKYTVTIGIGDNDRHDRFVDVCAISMFMEPNEDYMHAPNFKPVFMIVDNLLKLSKTPKVDSVISLDDFKTTNLRTAWSRFSTGLWGAIFAAIVTAFTLGASADSIKTQISQMGKANPSTTISPPAPGVRAAQ